MPFERAIDRHLMNSILVHLDTTILSIKIVTFLRKIESLHIMKLESIRRMPIFSTSDREFIKLWILTNSIFEQSCIFLKKVYDCTRITWNTSHLHTIDEDSWEDEEINKMSWPSFS